MPHVSEQHAQHDQFLVASLAAGDLAGTDRDRATALVTSCPDCAGLHDDLLAIARATAALPAAVRSRDFRISAEQAARLRPAGWRRFIAAFSSPRLAMTRRLGIGLTTLGLAGLLVSALPSMQIGSAGSAAASQSTTELSTKGSDSFAAPAAGAPSAAPTSKSVALDAVGSPVPTTVYGTAVGAPRPSPTDGRSSTGGGIALRSGSPQTQVDQTAPPQTTALLSNEAEGRGVPVTAIVSIVLVLAGISLLLVRRLAGRLAPR
jgi:uncharacterized protein YjeT (DUF2065 family)